MLGRSRLWLEGYHRESDDYQALHHMHGPLEVPQELDLALLTLDFRYPEMGRWKALKTDFIGLGSDSGPDTVRLDDGHYGSTLGGAEERFSSRRAGSDTGGQR